MKPRVRIRETEMNSSNHIATKTVTCSSCTSRELVSSFFSSDIIFFVRLFPSPTELGTMSCTVWCRLLVAVGVFGCVTGGIQGVVAPSPGLRGTLIEKTSSIDNQKKRTVDGAVVHDAGAPSLETTKKPFLEAPEQLLEDDHASMLERAKKDSTILGGAQAALETGKATVSCQPDHPCYPHPSATDAACLQSHDTDGQIHAYVCNGRRTCCCVDAPTTQFGSAQCQRAPNAAVVSAGPIWTVLLLSLLVSSWTSSF